MKYFWVIRKHNTTLYRCSTSNVQYYCPYQKDWVQSLLPNERAFNDFCRYLEDGYVQELSDAEALLL